MAHSHLQATTPQLATEMELSLNDFNVDEA